MKVVLQNAVRAAFLVAAAILPACGGNQPSLRVNSAPPPLATYSSVQIVCTSEEEKAMPYTGRLESQVMVKLKERETFKEYRLSRDPGMSELVVNVRILDLTKSTGTGTGRGWG